MNRFLAAVCVAGLSLSLSGCGSNADSLMKEQVAAYKDLADAAQAKDSGKADAAIKRISELNQQLMKMPPQEIQEAQKKYASDVSSQMQRIVAADPAIASKLMMNQMGDAFKAMGAQMPAQMKQMMENAPKVEFKQPDQ